MKVTSLITALAATLASAQVRPPSVRWNDTRTGITFEGFRNADYQIGFALPQVGSSVTNEFVGQIVGRVAGWAGTSFGGGMTNTLLLVAWANGQSIVHGFRFTQQIMSPPLYNKQPAPVLTPICESGAINSTHFTLTFICQNCNRWLNQQNQNTGWDFTAQQTNIGRAINARARPNNPADRGSQLQAHTEAGQFVLNIQRARTGNYTAFRSACQAPVGGTTTTTPLPGWPTTPTPTTTANPFPGWPGWP